MTGKDQPGHIAGSASTLPRPEAEEERLEAIALLAGQGDTSSAAQLTEMLADPRWRIRRAAADALARCAEPGPTIQAVLEAMRGGYRDLGLLNGVLSVLELTHLDVLPALTEFLTAADPDLRIYAAQVLGERGDPAAVPALLSCLTDTDVNVRTHAIEALGKLQSARATDALLIIALSGEFATAWPALDALGAIGDARIAPLLLPLLENDLLAEAAVLALGRLGNEESVAALIAVLDRGHVPATTVAGALDLLQTRYAQWPGEELYIPTLVRGLLQPPARARLLAAVPTCTAQEAPALARALGWLDGPEVIDALLALLTRGEARHAAAEALVSKGAGITAALSSLLHAEDSHLVRKVLEIIGRTGARAQVPALIGMLEHDDALTPVVIGALAMIGDERAYPALTKFLGHPRANVRQATVAAINCIAHPARLGDLQTWLQIGAPLVRESALKIACYLGLPECLDLVMACCNDQNENIRAVAVENLALLEDERAGNLVVRALKSESSVVRAAAARALPMAQPKLSTGLLVDALGDADVWVRYFAANGLGSEPFLHPSDLNVLEELAANDPATQVRIAAILALAPSRSTDVLPLLKTLATAADGDVARAALKTIGAIPSPAAVESLQQTLEQGDVDRRLAAIEALGTHGGVLAVDLLARAVLEQPPELARAAVVALEQSKHGSSVRVLIGLLARARWRETCTQLLINKVRRNGESIAWGLTHEDLDVRRTVALILSRAPSREGNAALHRAQSDLEPAVRFAVLTALAHVPRFT